MRMSDIIEEFIKDLFDDDNQLVEIQRNELAEQFNCVPSQIISRILCRKQKRWWRSYYHKKSQ